MCAGAPGAKQAGPSYDAAGELQGQGGLTPTQPPPSQMISDPQQTGGGDYASVPAPTDPTQALNKPAMANQTNPQMQAPWLNQLFPGQGQMPWQNSNFPGQGQMPWMQQPRMMYGTGGMGGGGYGAGGTGDPRSGQGPMGGGVRDYMGRMYGDRSMSPRAYTGGAFVPGMGQFGNYGAYNPNSFTGSRNGMNYLNGGLYAEEGLNQGGQAFPNFLSYLSRFGYGR